MKCSHCKKDINDGAKKCPECQTDLRNWFIRHKIISILLGLFLLGTVLSVIDDAEQVKLPPTVNSNRTETVTIDNNTEQSYVSVIDLKTGTQKNSDTFTLAGGKQRLVYKIDKKQFAGCSIYILDENTDLQQDGGIPVVMMAEEGGETILRKRAGNYYLSVQSANTNCSVELFERR